MDKKKKHTLRIHYSHEFGEWSVVWYTDGKRDEGKTYYTNDKQDAIKTRMSMQDQIDEGRV